MQPDGTSSQPSPTGSLYRPPALDALRGLVERRRDDMTANELDFFEASQRAEARLARLRFAALGAAAFVIAAAVATAFPLPVRPRRTPQSRPGCEKSLMPLARVIHRMPGIRWRMSRKALFSLKDWVSKPSRPFEHAEPHPPCPTILCCRSTFQPWAARRSLRPSMVGA